MSEFGSNWIKGKLWCGMLTVMLWLPLAASAASTLLTDSFDGSEPKREQMPGNEWPTCDVGLQWAYMDVGTFQVSATGNYTVYDALYMDDITYNGVDIVAFLYTGPFNSDDPNANLVTQEGIDEFNYVDLEAGVDYTLVVQQWCEYRHHKEGAWAVSFSGPGNVISSRAAIVPDMTEGLFTNDDPVAADNTDCGASQYQQFGPMQVSTTGTYYYSDVSLYFDVDMCLQVYSASFNPNDPSANRVSTAYNQGDYLDDVGTVELVAGQDYYFVVQPFNPDTAQVAGEYFFVFTGPAPFRINKSLAGAWFNPQTDGQGILLDVYDSINQLFLAWFTFDLTRPVDGTAELGEPGHRWLTGLGPIDGNKAEITVYNTPGGVFDAAQPPADPPQEVGTMTVEFTDCNTATVDYSLDTPPVSGQVPIQTLSDDYVELCDSLSKGPAEPGPL